jgi:hypothetical protein
MRKIIYQANTQHTTVLINRICFLILLLEKMNFASGLLGKAIIKSKTSSIEKSLSSGISTEAEEPQGAMPERSRRKAPTKDERASMLSLAHSVSLF